MPIIRITLKGLASFMDANASQQRRILRNFKFPDPEGAAQARYYRDVRSAIDRYHTSGNDLTVLITAIRRLTIQAQSVTGPSLSRIRANIACITSYASHFMNRQLTPLSSPVLQLQFGSVLVPTTPDLFAQEGRRRRLIKWEFSTEAPSDRQMRIMAQALFEASEIARLGLSPSAVQVLDIRRGETHGGARMGARLRTEMADACRNIESLWPGIQA